MRNALLIASLVLLADVRLCAAGMIVDFADAGLSVQVPGGLAAPGSESPIQSLRLSPADLAQSILSLQNQSALTPTARLADRLQGALRSHVRAGAPMDRAVAAQYVVAKAMADPEFHAEIQTYLQTGTSDHPAHGKDAAEGLARLVVAAKGERSQAELNGYFDNLAGAANEQSVVAPLAGGPAAARPSITGLHGSAPSAHGGTIDGASKTKNALVFSRRWWEDWAQGVHYDLSPRDLSVLFTKDWWRGSPLSALSSRDLARLFTRRWWKDWVSMARS